MEYLIFFPLLFFPLIISNAFAEEPILITISSDIDEVVFDGKWTNFSEWKRSSYDMISFSDSEIIHLRTAHKENFVYVQINPTFDTSFDKGFDNATVCFDTNNDKTMIPQIDDFCFSTIIDKKNNLTFRGDPYSKFNESFTPITNHQDFIAIGGISDNNDPYSKIPHVVYEFKIPLELLGRSDNYGFYFEVFDASLNKTYSWPNAIINNGSTIIPSTEKWGDLVSPDKSLPEFNFANMIFFLIPTILMISFMTRFSFFKSNIFNF